ncbi:hypothetical protein B0T10DRAFT_567321 [Thelonectria olida]|uniref:PD-(D/E)XK nuclease-like domain-containing protein n=1 Tax=Thelonectria olida TaxID=1576542 RepID=A0A9P9ALC9_9HYPO|nr:hypothetical protein B0T10DRAFT_567321 [Thelonectria olida]
MALSLDEAGFDSRHLDIDKPPVDSASLLFSVPADISDGDGILPLDRRDDILNTTTPRPHKSFPPRSIGTKMIGYCIYADRGRDNPVLEHRLQLLSQKILTPSVNHVVDVKRLQLRPIAMNIETQGLART